MDDKKLAFIGTGIIGAGLAVNALTAGYNVTLYDVADLEAAKERVNNILDTLVDAEAFDRNKADEALVRASFTNDLEEAVTDAVFIQESVPERLDLKKSIFRQIQEITGNSPIIASATTALMPSELQEDALYPGQILVGHPYNPSYILPLIEVVPGKQTSYEAVRLAYEMYNSWGKVAVICQKENYGYIAQHFNWGVRDIARKLVRDGICTAEDADKAIMYGPGMRFPVTGQLLTMALGVEGGWKNFSLKYYGTEPTQEDLELDRAVRRELADRPEEIGNNTADVLRFRDRTLVTMLKLQNLL